jgi:hypothetical protein
MASDGMTLYHLVPSRSCRVLWLINVSCGFMCFSTRRACCIEQKRLFIFVTLAQCPGCCGPICLCSWSQTPLTVLCLQQELGLPVNIVEKDFLKDPAVLDTDEFKKVNPAGKCVSHIHPAGY